MRLIAADRSSGEVKLPGTCQPPLVIAIFLLITVAAGQGFEGPLRIGVMLPATAAEASDRGQPPAGAAEAARLGAQFAREELLHNASLLGIDVDVLIVPAEDDALLREAGRLVEEEGVFGLVGGFGVERARALSALTREIPVPFLNIGAPDDRLRNEECSAFTFHVAPSHAMYIDALTGWFIRSGFRRWAFVHEESDAGRELYSRAKWALTERHFGGREVGRVEVGQQEADWERVLTSLQRAEPQVVMVLLEPERQLRLLRLAVDYGAAWQIAGLPYPEAQTRSFYRAWVGAAEGAEPLFRASGWEATLDAYGAREFNERFEARFGIPMDESAWAAYQAIRILYDSAVAARSTDGSEVASYLASPSAVFDVWKGIGVSFRPWDQQLRQSLYLVQLAGMGEGEPGEGEPGEVGPAVTLVGELPAIYMPRSDPVERLDQLGDLEQRSRCRLQQIDER